MITGDTKMITITNLESREVETLHRDVCHEHSEWIHQQLGTGSESELQHFLDQYSEDAFYGEDGRHLGPDVAGVSFRDGDGDAAIQMLKAALAAGDFSEIVMVTEWDDVTAENGWDNITAFAVVDSPLINGYIKRGDYYLAETYDGSAIVLTQSGNNVATMNR